MPRTPALACFEGCLLGGMVGDCLGLPLEGLSCRRAGRLLPPPLRHRFLPGLGMASDDTEHACMTAQALLRADMGRSTSPRQAGPGAGPGDGMASGPWDGMRGWTERDIAAFSSSLAWRLRGWLLAAPAGVGWATLRSIARLWLGSPPWRSGVASAGNGPLMRAPVIGVFFWDDMRSLAAVSRASSRITHTDPRAVRAAQAAALAARYAAVHGPGEFSLYGALVQVSAAFPPEDTEARAWLEAVHQAASCRWEPGRFAERMGFKGGVSGYAYHTLPAALYAWLAGPEDFRGGMDRALGLGGDTDTVAAVFASICGAGLGPAAIPADWLDGIRDWPRSAAWVRRLAGRLHSAAVENDPRPPLPLAWPALPLRNALFAAVVLCHGLRRLLPPY